MGMSASQARLLSITGRLTNNEYQAQTLTNSKIRLSEVALDARAEYNNSLDATQLIFNSYNGDGLKQTSVLTASNLMSYGDSKNQYVLVNNSGNVLVSSVDAMNYQKANSLDDFLSNYVPEIQNPKYVEQYNKIYGKNWMLFENDDIYQLYNNKIAKNDNGSSTVHNILNKVVKVDEGVNSVISLVETDSDGNWIKDENGMYIVNSHAVELYNNTRDEVLNCRSTAKFSETDDTSVYGSLLSTLDKLPIAPATSGISISGVSFPQKPEKPVYPVEPQQADFQMENSYVDPLYSDLFQPLFSEVGVSIRDTSIALLEYDKSYSATDGTIVTNDESMVIYDKDGEELWITPSYNGPTGSAYATQWANGMPDIINGIWGENGDEKLQKSIVELFRFMNQICESKSDDSLLMNLMSFTYERTEEDRAREKDLYQAALADYEAAKEDLEAYEEYLLDPIYWPPTMTEKKAAMEVALEKVQAYEKIINSEDNVYTAERGKCDQFLFDLVTEKLYQDVVKYMKLNGQPEIVDDVDAYNKAVEERETLIKALDAQFELDVENYNKTVENLCKNFEDSLLNTYNTYSSIEKGYKSFLDKLATIEPEIVDTTDIRYQWYKNLWFRMGAGEKDNYKQIDNDLMNNSKWLQQCFEQGILTLEHAIFSAEGSTSYPQMGTFEWISKDYNNILDISSKEDENAVAAAEVKYSKTMKEIENKDKKLDQDLKNLDTEHSALQAEYESIKSAINKNVERSFKLFS